MKVIYQVVLAIAALCLLTSAAYGGVDGKIGLVMQWKGPDGQAGQQELGTIPVKSILGKGFWVAFKQGEGGTLPGVFMAGEFVPVSTPIEKMKSLALIIKYEDMTRSLEEKVVIFSEDRAFGSRKVTPENVYHILVLADTAADGNQPSSFEPSSVAVEGWRGPFGRMHMLALNYVKQSDTKRREFEKVFGVQTRYEIPRLILAAEEWLDIPREVQKKKKSSDGLFGGALESVAEEIEGKPEVTATKIPVYSIDVLLDEIEANGKYPMGFEAARSMYNDILEGKVIYEASGGKRKILTASAVFSQLERNKSEHGTDNKILNVDVNNLAELDKCEQLWPSAKENIKDFLGKQKGWKVIIPTKPVTFYENNKPIYAMYAWFRVQPSTGRMVGMLANNMHGAVSDEMAKLEGTLIDKAKEAVGEEGGAVKTFFSQVAGMYVSSAGILDAVGLTICDPNLANLSDEEWRKFVTMHSLDFCQKFLEDQADTYDSYASRLAFWQGAMLITGDLGGKEGAAECARRAVQSVVDKAVSDAKAGVEKRLEEAKEAAGAEARAIFDETMEKYAPEVKSFVEGVEELSDVYDKAVETKEAVDDYKNRANAVWDEICTKTK